MQLLDHKNDYNIFFIEREMQGMDGIEFAKELKSKNLIPVHAPVVIMLSNELYLIDDEAKDAGTHKMLYKPPTPSDIIDFLNELIGVKVKNEDYDHEYAARFEGRRILLAEDVDINREIVMAFVEPTHLMVDSAEDGAIAVDMFKNNPEMYDAIFMDVQMPNMDGYDATGAIRSLDIPNAKTIPIIAMTANVFREDIEKCLEAGMNDHIGKPIDMNILLNILSKYLPHPE